MSQQSMGTGIKPIKDEKPKEGKGIFKDRAKTLWLNYRRDKIKSFNDLSDSDAKIFLQHGVDNDLLEYDKIKPEVIKKYNIAPKYTAPKVEPKHEPTMITTGIEQIGEGAKTPSFDAPGYMNQVLNILNPNHVGVSLPQIPPKINPPFIPQTNLYDEKGNVNIQAVFNQGMNKQIEENRINELTAPQMVRQDPIISPQELINTTQQDLENSLQKIANGELSSDEFLRTYGQHMSQEDIENLKRIEGYKNQFQGYTGNRDQSTASDNPTYNMGNKDQKATNFDALMKGIKAIEDSEGTTNYEKQFPAYLTGKRDEKTENPNPYPAYTPSQSVTEGTQTNNFDNIVDNASFMPRRFMAGVGSGEAGINNTLNLLYQGLMAPLDWAGDKFLKSTPFEYNLEDDPINKGMKTITKKLEGESQGFRDRSPATTGLGELLGSTTEAVGNIGVSALFGKGMPTNSKFVKSINDVIRMIPFGMTKGGNMAREVEKDGGDIWQQLGTATLTGINEIATELLPFELGMKLFKSIKTSGFIKNGLKKMGLWSLTTGGEAFQEVVVSPLDNIVLKTLVDKDTEIASWSQAKEDALGGIALSVFLTAIGLPVSTVSYKMARKRLEQKQPIDGEFIEDLAEQIPKDTNGEVDIKKELKEQINGEMPVIPPEDELKININKMSQEQLQEELNNLGLDTKGTKSELRNRLEVARNKSKSIIDENPVKEGTATPPTEEKPLNEPETKSEGENKKDSNITESKKISIKGLSDKEIAEKLLKDKDAVKGLKFFSPHLAKSFIQQEFFEGMPDERYEKIFDEAYGKAVEIDKTYRKKNHEDIFKVMETEGEIHLGDNDYEVVNVDREDEKITLINKKTNKKHAESFENFFSKHPMKIVKVGDKARYINEIVTIKEIRKPDKSKYEVSNQVIFEKQDGTEDKMSQDMFYDLTYPFGYKKFHEFAKDYLQGNNVKEGETPKPSQEEAKTPQEEAKNEPKENETVTENSKEEDQPKKFSGKEFRIGIIDHFVKDEKTIAIVKANSKEDIFNHLKTMVRDYITKNMKNSTIPVTKWKNYLNTEFFEQVTNMVYDDISNQGKEDNDGNTQKVSRTTTKSRTNDIIESDGEQSEGISEDGIEERDNEVRDREVGESNATINSEDGRTREPIPRKEEHGVHGESSESEVDTTHGMGLDNEGDTSSSTRLASRENYRIGPNFQQGGFVVRYKNNIKAIKVLKQLEKEGRKATRDEQEILSKYVGWGGLPQAFNQKDKNHPEWYQELKELLTEEEYKTASRSMLNAHYTAKEVIDGMYKAVQRLGFKKGRVLEPAMGVGNFFGLLPDKLTNTTKLHGVELDKLTGRIAKQLYQNAKIDIKGYQDVNYADNYFDMAISNVPFGSTKIKSDKRYKNFLIHDYFFAKTIDKVKEGGLIAFVTSKGTMDKLNATTRKYISERADFLGAIRLPNIAFKKNANTSVTTDVIFLRKLKQGETAKGEDWITIKQTSEGVPINEYYVNHPEMLLGKMIFDSSMYGNEKETALIGDGRDLSQSLDEAIEKLPQNVMDTTNNNQTFKRDMEDDLSPEEDEKEGSLVVRNGVPYQVINGTLEKVVTNMHEVDKPHNDLPKTRIKRMEHLIRIKKAVRETLRLQVENKTEKEMKQARRKLNILYDNYVKVFTKKQKGVIKKGYINQGMSSKIAFGKDPDWSLLQTLENYNDKTGEYEKADLFSKRVIVPKPKITHTDNAKDALSVTLNEIGFVDMDRMKELTGKDENTIIKELKDIIYKNPIGSWETANKYLGGNVREKLRIAKEYAEKDPMFKVNVEALEKNQPKDLKASEIEKRIGTNWITKEDYTDFARELFETESLEVDYVPQTGAWMVEGTITSDTIENQRYGTKKLGAKSILSKLLNSRPIKVDVIDHFSDGTQKKNKERSKEETQKAQQKAKLILSKFDDWVFSDSDRRNKLVKTYNELFNSEVLEKFDGSMLTYDGLVEFFKPRDYQNNAVARVLFGGNTLLAHAVGAGKTAEMVIAGMELKRMGLANKPMFVVPNHLVEQWRSSFLELYPNANILGATKYDFEKKHRALLFSKIANNNWDAVIVSHSGFGKIPMSRQAQMDYLNEEIEDLEYAIRSLQISSDNESQNIEKKLQGSLDKLEEKLKELQDDDSHDDYLTFEELGTDYLFVDEAHNFKNLFFATKMGRIAGIPNSTAKKSTDMYMKTRYVTGLHNNKAGLVYATGTPISNAMSELYTMQKYLQMPSLEDRGLKFFDNWATAFGNIVSKMEVDKTGSGIKMKQRFSEFYNVPELIKMFRSFADVVTSEDLDGMKKEDGTPVLKRPQLEGGEAIAVEIERSNEQEAYINDLIARSEACERGTVDPTVDNPLKITNDGRLCALDMRLIAPSYGEDKNGKLYQAADNILTEYEDGKDDKLTQFVFSDLGTPKAKGSSKVTFKGYKKRQWYYDEKQGQHYVVLDVEKLSKKEAVIFKLFEDENQEQITVTTKNLDRETEQPKTFEGDLDSYMSEDDDIPEVKFDIYNALKEILIKKGIPENEIAFIHDAKSDIAKEKLFAKVRSGKVRVLMGSTAKMGEGMNAQDRAVALHHLDAPWKPSGVEQRNGRIIRHGNMNEKVRIYHYVTKGSFDAYIWQLIEMKAKFISQIMKGDLKERTIKDVFDPITLNASKVKALASLDPRILEKVNLEQEITEVQTAKKMHLSDKYDMEDTISRHKKRISVLEKENKIWEKVIKGIPDTRGDNFKIEIKGKTYTKRKDAGKVLIKLMKSSKGTKEDIKIGTFAGFDIFFSQDKYTNILENTEYYKSYVRLIKNNVPLQYINLSKSEIGNMSKLENAIGEPSINIGHNTEEIGYKKKEIPKIQEELNIPFQQDEKLQELQARLVRLDQDLMGQTITNNDSSENDVPPQFQGNTAESDKVGIVAKGFAGSIPMEEHYEYDDKDLEYQRKQNRLNPATYRQKISKWASEFKKSATRTFRNLPVTKEFADAYQELVNYPTIKARAIDESMRKLNDIINNEQYKLTAEEYNRFSRIVLLKDLQEEIKLEHDLPGGYTDENVPVYLDQLLDSSNEQIDSALAKRKKYMDNTVEKYIKAMKAIGFNVENKFKKENYFRHQVLDYMQANELGDKITGSGSDVKVKRNRGWLKERKGSTMEINENYLQAEFEVLTNMLNDTLTAEMIKRIGDRYDIKPQLKKQAKKINDKNMSAIITAEALTGNDKLEKEYNKLNGMISSGFEGLRDLALDEELWDDNGKYKKEVAELRKSKLDRLLAKGEDSNLFHYLSELKKNGDEESIKYANFILKGISNKKKLMKSELGENFKTWESMLPQEYAIWQPIVGYNMYMANTISENLADAFAMGIMDNLSASDKQIRQVMAMGSKRRTYVLPSEIATTMNDIYNKQNKVDNPVSKVISIPQKLLKMWYLTGNPRQVIKYNLRNATGDLDGLIASAGFKSVNAKYIHRSSKEIYNAMRYMKFTPDLLEWRDKGGFQSLLYANEIADITNMNMFRHLDKIGKDKAYKNISKTVFNLPSTYLEFTRNMTDYRESILRYSAYLFYKDHLNKNEGLPEFYGASNPNLIQGLSSVNARAYQLSKDALGAYDEITEFGQIVRKYLILFYSWNEVNTKRYFRVFKNTVNNKKLQEQAGRKVANDMNLGKQLSQATLLKLGALAIRVMFLNALLWLFNNTVMKDDEDDLPESIRNSPHLTLGRDKNGDVRYFSRLGAFNDLLEWFGLDTLQEDIKELNLERKTVGEQVSDMAFSPVNKLINSLSPFFKTPAELISGKTFFPDAREPRTIRDRWYHISQTFGLQEEYSRLTGKPVKESYAKSWLKAVIYKTDPKANAYYRILDLKRKFERNEQGKYPAQAFNESPKSEALYYFKLSLKYGDEKKAKEYLADYFGNGGTQKGLKQSIRMMHPLYGLGEGEQSAFKYWLTEGERKDLDKAMQYYHETFY